MKTQDDFFASDDEEEDQHVPIYERDTGLRAKDPYEDQFTKAKTVFNDFIEKLNTFEEDKNYPYCSDAFKAIKPNDTYMDTNEGIFNVIEIHSQQAEIASLMQKLAAVFSILDYEINRINQQFSTQVYNPLILYGIRSEKITPQEGEKEVQIGRMLPTFRIIFDQLRRTSYIISNIVNQLHALYYKKDIYHKNHFKYFNLFSPFDSLGKALSLIYNIDLIIQENPAIREHWNMYKKMLKIVHAEPSRYNITEAQLKKLERQLSKFDKTILSGNCFVGFISVPFDIPAGGPSSAAASAIKIKDNKELYELFKEYFKHSIDQIAERVGQNIETQERESLQYLLCCYALYRKLFPEQEDRDLWKSIWQIQKKCPVLIIGSHIMLNIADFMESIVPLSKKSKGKDPKDPIDFLNQYIQKRDDSFETDIQSFYQQFCGWAVKMDSNIAKLTILRMESQITELFKVKAKYIMQGFWLATQIKHSITSLIMLHVKKQAKLTKSIVSSFCLGIMMLKGIKTLLLEHEEGLAPFFVCKYLSRSANLIVAAAIQRAQTNKSNHKPPVLYAANLLLHTFRGAHNHIRQSIMNYCLNFLWTKKDPLIKEKEFDDLRYELWRLDIISDYKYHVADITDCSLIYWTRDLIPIFYQHIYQNPTEMKRLEFLHLSYADTENQLKSALHLEDNMELLNEFKEFILENFTNEMVKKICKDIDIYLRLQIHSVLIDQIRVENPFKTGAREIQTYLTTPPVKLFERIVDLRDEVTRCLNNDFYNMNALNLYDYETYELIRSLGRSIFGLDLIHPYIPSQSLQKGNIDILNIMRGIQQFVVRFNYNLHTQQFIESTKDSLVLNTVGIQQIADSIQTHGLGILNTSINFVYRFVLKKFNTFSQFLYDELIQSPLLREVRYFKENKETLDGKYPYDRADLLGKEIKRLGEFEDGRTFLDKFRMLVTTIGNSLGFVRLLRSASINYCSKHIESLPYSTTFVDPFQLSEEEQENFEEYAKKASFSNGTVEAAKQLDSVIKDLKENFSEKSDYLRVLVKTFETVVQGPENKHLQLFYIILPSLIINYIDASLIAKEKLGKKNAPDAYICDDGFVLGAAYLLKLLGQNHKFESLHWFEEVDRKFSKDMKKIKDKEDQNSSKDKSSGPKDSEEIALQLQLSMRKLKMQLEEFKMLFYSFQSANILFRDINH